MSLKENISSTINSDINAKISSDAATNISEEVDNHISLKNLFCRLTNLFPSEGTLFWELQYTVRDIRYVQKKSSRADSFFFNTIKSKL